MVNLSEEEKIVDRVSMIDQWKTSGDIYTQDELNAIGELLDLYYKQQKQIERQDKLIEKLLNIKLYACDENKNKECNKKNCYVNGGGCDATTDITKVKYINLDDYVSKDELREIIKEKAKTDTYNFKTIDIKDLEEILGE